jgi:hypothetical protein
VRSVENDVFSLISSDVVHDLSLSSPTNVKSVSDVAIEVSTATPSVEYTVVLNGVTVTITSQIGATLANVAEDLYDAMILADIPDVSLELRTYQDGAVRVLVQSIVSMIAVSHSDIKLTMRQGMRFRSDEVGEVPVFIGDFGAVSTPIGGVSNAVVSYHAGVVGKNIETDAELRVRREESIMLSGGATVDAIRARLLNNVPNIVQAFVIENDLDVEDSGLKPHSILVVAEGGTSVDVANEIFASKSAGIATNGTTTVAVEDIQGVTHTISFSRPMVKPFNIAVEVTRSNEVPFPVGGVDSIKQNIVDMFSRLAIGQDVLYQKIFTPIYAVNGVADVQMGILFNADGVASFTDPAHKFNLAVGFGEFATVALSDISVTLI